LITVGEVFIVRARNAGAPASASIEPLDVLLDEPLDEPLDELLLDELLVEPLDVLLEELLELDDPP
jgi:hypothetical protein